MNIVVKENTVVIIAVGDSIGRTCNDSNPFVQVTDIFRNADLLFMNLETVLTEEKKPVAQKWIHIRTEPSAIQFLQELEINVVNNVAHNHTLDYGVGGFSDTLDCLIKAGISPIGASKSPDSMVQPAIFDRNGLKIAFVGFMYPIFDPSKEIFIADISNPDETFQVIRDLRESCDVLIVSLHWGAEHVIHPSPEQIEFAHRLIDNGTHLVIGHHSHCVQGVERYKNGLIAYALGNFNFWQPDVETKWFNRLSVILRVELARPGILDYELIPVWIDESYSPAVMQDEETKYRARDYFQRLSQDIVDGSITWTAWYEEVGWTYISQTMRSFAITLSMDSVGLERCYGG